MKLRHLSLPVAVLCLSSCSRASAPSNSPTANDRNRAAEELSDAAVVVREMASTDRIRRGHRDRAQCVVVVPSMLHGAIGIGAQHGNGVVACRTAGGWSGPAFVSLTGGSAGFQVGLQSSDLVMLVTSGRGMEKLFRESFQLGGDISAAAGPVGVEAQAGTDTTMTAEILTYARSRGLFAGVDVAGAVMKQDAAATSALYGPGVDAHAILSGDVAVPKEARALLDEMRTAFPPTPNAAL
jgi:lipid-binding SYLF domain-containing protein